MALRRQPALEIPQHESKARSVDANPPEIARGGPVTDALTAPYPEHIQELQDKVEALAAGLQAARERVSELRNEVLRLHIDQGRKREGRKRDRSDIGRHTRQSRFR